MLDPENRMPLYHQVESHLKENIGNGTWKAGEAIPPERMLVDQYGVSRITIRQALANLVAAGLLYRKHGKGTFVAGAQDRPITESLANLTGHLEELQLRGLNPQVRVLALETRTLAAEVAEALERSPAAPGWYLYRLVTVDRQPLMLSTVWLPRDLEIELTEDILKQHGMALLLTRNGIFPLRGRQRIGASSAGPEEAQLLGIRPGDAVLCVKRVIYGAASRPLVWFRTLYRSDRYEYEVELKRGRSQA
ncbi:GntR family transcriptional regulator [Pelobacter propionicus]|uniref:Transcriptional regulator, GntR family n=1 Tax=Pelobacter propionicus (strain DSM 2379 / NBRC 103807 / OttBd1) TaxID=338966 RepID=A1AN97_PELPD|nr:GntR family transcriptional regulator [Pelobacter propionicus]ABK98817.1 transcriptional regulator, GntR family [Pelobacter propionicus DSM 2379]